MLTVGGVERRQPSFGGGADQGAHPRSSAWEGNPSARPSSPWLDPASTLVVWAQCCYRDQQSDHCTLRTCFPERWTTMRMCVGHLNIDQCFPIFLPKSQEREALHSHCQGALSSNILPPIHQASFLAPSAAAWHHEPKGSV